VRENDDIKSRGKSSKSRESADFKAMIGKTGAGSTFNHAEQGMGRCQKNWGRT